MKNTALIFSGLIFLFISAMHFIRYFKGWEIVVAHHNIPLQWSIYGGIIIAVLAIWMFIAAAQD